MIRRYKRIAQRELEKKARQLLQSPLFLFRVLQKMAELGVEGEHRNCLIVVLACLTRTLPWPVSVLVKGSTSSGKSTIVESSIKLFAPSCIVERAGLSKKALAYGNRSLAKAILFLNEYRCGKDAQQFTRLLQTQGQISHESTTISGSKRGTRTLKRVGVPVVLSTTTDEQVFADDETRFLSIFVDESPEQSRRIVLARSRKPRASDVTDLPIWQKATSLVTHRKGDFENPPKWMEFVAKHLPHDKVRVRRDWDRFLSFCSAVALLRSFGSSKAVDISFEDYCIAYRILEPVFASTLHNQESEEHVLAKIVAELSGRQQRAVSVREIAAKLGLKKPVVYKRVKRAIKKRLIKYAAGTREKNLKLVLPVGQGTGRFLPHPRVVLKHNPELGKKVTYIDPLSGKKRTVRRSHGAK